VKLKLDENLGKSSAGGLRQAGHEVATVPEQGLFGIGDRTLVETCLKEGRCLVTLDMEFGNPLLFKPSDYPGIVVLRLPPRPTPQDLADAVQTLIRGLERESVKGKLWVVQRGRIREYQPEEEHSNG
jgi:predicted nuclease of predicted toxin-antitoxin system